MSRYLKTQQQVIDVAFSLPSVPAVPTSKIAVAATRSKRKTATIRHAAKRSKN